ncbi:RNA 2',3'-cyclic phosphodiesterase [Lentibacillus sp. N15]|uniref:RNA 2',3'-cyclic phosphodiesterase n=1 Tax=Lentibacillus songyuanensis TaxID=3136161 RepID=UPI0031BA3F07
MTSFPHYFIGIPVSTEWKKTLFQWQKELKPLLPYKQWTNKHDLHITLKFLGPVEDKKIHLVAQTLQQLENQDSFILHVGGVGTFGNANNPRVLWAGARQQSRLSELHQVVESSLTAYGFAKEKRPYRPHITLAKKWAGTNGNDELPNIMENYQHKIDKMRVTQVVLFQIYPEQTPKYKKVSSYELRGGTHGTVN